MRSGKDRGKQGKVLQVLPVEHKVVIEGLNTFVKHLAPQGGKRRKTEGAEKGQRIELSRPVPISTVPTRMQDGAVSHLVSTGKS